VLLVEDDRGLRESLATVLSFQGLTVLQADSAEVAAELVASDDPDLVVLDINLPGQSGLDFLAQLRAAGDARQVLLLTARHEVADRVAGLDAGADDYLPKPFALDEMLARVRLLLRRATVTSTATPAAAPIDPVGDSIVLGPVTIDAPARRVMSAGAPVDLTKLEYDLLHLLVTNNDIVLTRSVIHQRIWGYDEEYGSNILEALVSSLRRKLEAGGTDRVVHTVRGVGYVARIAESGSGGRS
jgi:two-component system response regulator MprA